MRVRVEVGSVVVALAVTFTLGGCGGSDAAESDPTVVEASDPEVGSEASPESAPAQEPAPEPEPEPERAPEPEAASDPSLTAVDLRGVEVTLDAVPERVVSIWDSIDAQNLLALDVEPVLIGRVNGGRPAPWVDDYAGIETYDLGAGPSIELLLQYDPDLIVTASYDDATYPFLEEIAPLYVADNSIPWRDELRRLAQLIGASERAEAVIADLATSIDEAAAALVDWQGASLLVAAVSPTNELTAFTDTSPISDLLVELGLSPLVASENGSATQSYSFELVSELEGDAFLFVDASGLSGFDLEASNQNFLTGPIVGTIPAAGGGVYRVSPESSAALRLVNAANLQYLLDELVAVLTADPSS